MAGRGLEGEALDDSGYQEREHSSRSAITARGRSDRERATYRWSGPIVQHERNATDQRLLEGERAHRYALRRKRLPPARSSPDGPDELVAPRSRCGRCRDGSRPSPRRRAKGLRSVQLSGREALRARSLGKGIADDPQTQGRLSHHALACDGGRERPVEAREIVWVAELSYLQDTVRHSVRHTPPVKAFIARAIDRRASGPLFPHGAANLAMSRRS